MDTGGQTGGVRPSDRRIRAEFSRNGLGDEVALGTELGCSSGDLSLQVQGGGNAMSLSASCRATALNKSRR